MKSKYYVAIAVILVLATGIYFLRNSGSKSEVANTTAPAGINENIGLESGNVAPDFKLKDVERGNFSKDDLKGKPLFIFFTTTWCTPCQIGATKLARYDDETGGAKFNVLVVFVDSSEPEIKMAKWKEKFGRDDWYIAKDNGIAQNYAVQYLDTKYVLDKNGIIKWKDLYPLSYDSAKSVLGPLLQ